MTIFINGRGTDCKHLCPILATSADITLANWPELSVVYDLMLAGF